MAGSDRRERFASAAAGAESCPPAPEEWRCDKLSTAVVLTECREDKGEMKERASLVRSRNPVDPFCGLSQALPPVYSVYNALPTQVAKAMGQPESFSPRN